MVFKNSTMYEKLFTYEGGPKSNGNWAAARREREWGNSLFDQVSVRKASPELVCEVLSL